MLSGHLNAVLLDLSLTGAQVHVRRVSLTCAPPHIAGEVLLQWCGFEAFGNVVWQHKGSEATWAGISFDALLDPALVIATRDQHDQISEDGGLRAIERAEVREWVRGIGNARR